MVKKLLVNMIIIIMIITIFSFKVCASDALPTSDVPTQGTEEEPNVPTPEEPSKPELDKPEEGDSEGGGQTGNNDNNGNNEGTGDTNTNTEHGNNEQGTNQNNETNSNANSENNNNENNNNENNNNEDNNENIGNGNNNNENSQNTNNQNNNVGNNDNNSTNKNENNNQSGTAQKPPHVPTSTTPVQTNNTEPKSSNANLNELKVNVEGLTPEFNKDVTEYYLIVDLKVEEIKVTATKADSKASVTVSGNKKLKEGKNTITVDVKAENGTVKKYYIYVTKTKDLEKANAELENLKIEGYDISPDFKQNIYNYNLNLENGVTNIVITAEAKSKKAKVEIEGNENLKEGENLIKISVTAEDGTTVRIYKVNAYVSPKNVEIQEENKMPIIIVLAVLGGLIIGLGSFVAIKNR